MPDILHRVGVEAPATRVFDALATQAGIRGVVVDAADRGGAAGGRPAWLSVRRRGADIEVFAQRHWREEVEFVAHCSTKWASFLLSLEALVEQGQGTPFPRGAKLRRWG